ncbi:MAG: hypothetical protein JWR25_500 [Noviherbaspirillum sp.]|jgi:hypothetical protein|nr:hypothetical protein [Noviherbaspirillum sp.]MDB5794121.1 hypothetical protein [Noviherbaspirillum sp.]
MDMPMPSGRKHEVEVIGDFAKGKKWIARSPVLPGDD